ncbi:M48 family metalloprotease [Thermococcus alcaliphilus]|uniref:M48 family metalloprotease n=1 Tax=Thermococcus alcaliphilus TaxID=139207 RepID=UPI002090A30C|nr:M48 family metalloprotease [Thermococcus alcaliphilus]MCO6041322.1 M48 family metalloprotease [Thermococcus alcaliphilus]
MEWEALFLPLLAIPIAWVIGRGVLKEERPEEELKYKLIKRELISIGLALILMVSTFLVLGFEGIDSLLARFENSKLEPIVFLGVFSGPGILAIIIITLIYVNFERKVVPKVPGSEEIPAWRVVLMLVVFICLMLSWPLLYWFFLSDKIGDSMPLTALSFAVYLFAIYIFLPYISMLYEKAEKNEEVEKDLLEFCSSLGIKVRGVRIVGGEEVNAMVSGILPFWRYITLTKPLLANFTPEEVKAILAHEIGHIKGKHLWINFAVSFGWFPIAVGFIEGLDRLEEFFNFSLVNMGFRITFVLLVGIFAILYIGYFYVFGGYVSFRNEFKADEYAARVVGTEAMFSALQKIARFNKIPSNTPKWFNFFNYHPSIEERLENLYRKCSAENENVDHSPVV